MPAPPPAPRCHERSRITRWCWRSWTPPVRWRGGSARCCRRGPRPTRCGWSCWTWWLETACKGCRTGSRSLWKWEKINTILQQRVHWPNTEWMIECSRKLNDSLERYYGWIGSCWVLKGQHFISKTKQVIFTATKSNVLIGNYPNYLKTMRRDGSTLILTLKWSVRVFEYLSALFCLWRNMAICRRDWHFKLWDN